jgi:hypothetical protein
MTPSDSPTLPTPAYDQYWAAVEDHPPAPPADPPAGDDAYAAFHSSVEG